MGLGYIAFPVLLISLIAPQVLVLYQQQYVIDWSVVLIIIIIIRDDKKRQNGITIL